MNEDSFTPEHELPDELISAYLDGELTPEEKNRVEEQLMDSADHRRLFEELKALRASLQSLPRESLGDDFAQRVLRRAEQELLTGDASKRDAAAKKRTAKVTRSGRESGTWRGLVWSAVAMAAAIALIVFSPLMNEQPPRGVALNDQSKPSDRAVEIADSNSKKEAGSDADLAASGRLKSDYDNKEKDASVMSNGRSEQDAQQSFGQSAGGTAGVENAATAKAEKQGEADLLDKLAGRRENRPSTNGGNRIGRAADGAAGLDVDAHAAQASEGGSNGRELANELASNLYSRGIGGNPPSAPQAALARAQLANADPGMLVVSVDVTADALADHFMDGMLRKHDIHLELAKAKVDEASLRLEEAEKLRQLAPGDGAAASAGEQESPPGNRVGDKGGQADKQPARIALAGAAPTRGGDVELMYVVASAEQIDSLLYDLKNQSDQVLALAYDHPPAANELKNKAAEALQARNFKAIPSPSLPQVDLAATAEPLVKEEEDARAEVGQDRDEGNAASFADNAHDDDVVDDRVRMLKQQGVQLAPAGGAFGKYDESANDSSKAGAGRRGQGEGLAAPAEGAAAPPQQQSIDAESFRGIAQRLHLPEEFHHAWHPRKRADFAVPDQAQGDEAPSPAAITQDSLGGGGTSAADDGSKLRPSGLNRAVQESAERQDSSGQRKVAPSPAAQPIRVLFVLRAAKPTAPLADQIPVEKDPKNAAALESPRE